ncbi:hypothetical protein ACFLSJ_07285 [Verrucomicrobiota bacterium]
MKNGKCPKCGSTSVYKNSYHGGFSGGVAVGAVTGFKINQYICADCGFIEEYMADMADVSKIIQKCEKTSVTE